VARRSGCHAAAIALHRFAWPRRQGESAWRRGQHGVLPGCSMMSNVWSSPAAACGSVSTLPRLRHARTDRHRRNCLNCRAYMPSPSTVQVDVELVSGDKDSTCHVNSAFPSKSSAI
jgi:hypothetical protein